MRQVHGQVAKWYRLGQVCLMVVVVDTPGHQGVGRVFEEYTTLPPITVARTCAWLIVSGEMEVKSRSSATRSARYPGASLPLFRSPKTPYALVTVYARRASSTVIF